MGWQVADKPVAGTMWLLVVRVLVGPERRLPAWSAVWRLGWRGFRDAEDIP